MRRKEVVPAAQQSVVDPLRDDDEDWRVSPCRLCRTHAMLWWRYCVFCGSELPLVLDYKVVKVP